jgi:Uma2 family endonuclease
MSTVAARPSKATVFPMPTMPVYRFTVEQYHRMIEREILTENDRVELLEGWITCKMPHNPPHDGTITRISRRLTRVLSDEWLIRVQCAITTRDSEPEPDLALVAGPEDIYFSRHPVPRDIVLLIEVADTTLEADRVEKGRLYARARIPVYWIVNLKERQIEVYTEPRGGKSPAYRQRKDYDREDSVPLPLSGHKMGEIPVRELLP